MVTVTRPPPKRPAPAPVKRRAPSPREPRVRKSGFRPILRMAAGRVRLLKAETAMGQICAVSVFVIVMCGLVAGGVRLAQEAEHRGAIALAAYDWCAQPRPVSHAMSCQDFACLASINEDNARYVRICHPEALRS